MLSYYSHTTSLCSQFVKSSLKNCNVAEKLLIIWYCHPQKIIIFFNRYSVPCRMCFLIIISCCAGIKNHGVTTEQVLTRKLQTTMTFLLCGSRRTLQKVSRVMPIIDGICVPPLFRVDQHKCFEFKVHLSNNCKWKGGFPVNYLWHWSKGSGLFFRKLFKTPWANIGSHQILQKENLAIFKLAG